MKPRPILALALAAIVLALGALPASAQDILGLSMRPTDEMPAGTGRGTVDIVSDGANQFKVTVDLSGAADNLKLENFEGATGFTVWAVDTNGVRHNLGQLDESLVLKDAIATDPIAKLYVTAEPDPAAASPTGKPLFTATLRNVTESEATATPATAAEATTAATTSAGAAAQPTGAPTATTAQKPKELPTTGDLVPDLLVLAIVAAGLFLVGWRLRTVQS
jgi:hypothetical protein